MTIDSQQLNESIEKEINRKKEKYVQLKSQNVNLKQEMLEKSEIMREFESKETFYQ